MYSYNPNLLLEDHAIPRFLRLTQEERNAAWVRNPPRPMPEFYQRNATQLAYLKSIERDKAIQRAKDEARWAILKARKAAEQAELALVAVAVKRRAR